MLPPLGTCEIDKVSASAPKHMVSEALIFAPLKTSYTVILTRLLSICPHPKLEIEFSLYYLDAFSLPVSNESFVWPVNEEKLIESDDANH